MDAPPVDTTPSESARKYHSLVLRRLLAAGQRPVAEALGMSETKISRLKSEGVLEMACQVLAEIGLKVVPAEMKCYRPQDIDPYIQLARQHMQQISSAEQLSWDEDPE